MSVHLDFATGALRGPSVTRGGKRLGDLPGLFEDQGAWTAMDPALQVYAVESFRPFPEGTPGAVCCATTWLQPGDVGGEYFMTRGHYHEGPDGPEMEVCLSGEGALVLMDGDRNTRLELMSAGTVHHVGPRTAHRTVNVGSVPLVFVSFWPSEIGHDYATIARLGFGGRVKRVDGRPVLVMNAR